VSERTPDPGSSREAADRLLDKLRGFVESLDADERELFAALLAPGVAQAYVGAGEAEDVSGFSGESAFEADTVRGWSPSQLPEALAARLRDGRLRIELD
jgi:hypothetical protein